MGNVTVKNLGAVCATSNASGLKPYIQITTEEEVSAIPAATAGAITDNMTMRAFAAGPPEIAAGTFKKWNVSKVPSKNIWDSVNLGDADSGARQTTVTVFIPKMTKERLDAIYGGCSFIIGVPDQNGVVRLVGEKDNGCTATYQETINDNTNGVTVVFTWISGYYPYVYEGTFPA